MADRELLELLAIESDDGEFISYADIANTSNTPVAAFADLTGVPADMLQRSINADLVGRVAPTEGTNASFGPQGMPFQEFIDEHRRTELLKDTRKLEASWPDFEYGVDYSHMLDHIQLPRDFSLTDRTLRWLIEKNHFRPTAQQNIVIFGLRGCEIASGNDDTQWTDSLQLRWTTPDHRTFRCVMGVHNFETGRLRAFTASTVPNQENMYRYVKSTVTDSKRMCNLLPCGMYKYRVGVHRGRDDGCLTMAGLEMVVVLRTIFDLTYRSDDVYELWHATYPGDNIHSSYYNDPAHEPRFSSAGCQVVLGTHQSNEPTGPWQEFRISAGLSDIPDSADERRFDYVLLTGLEAALADHGTADAKAAYDYLRFGSSGDAVKQLQAALAIPQTGAFDWSTALAVRSLRLRRGDLEATLIGTSDVTE